MSLSPSDDSTVSAFLTTLSLEECSHLTPDLGTVPIHNTFPIDSTHAALLQNYPLLSPHLDDLKHQFEWHQMEQYLIFDIDTGLMEYWPQKTWRYRFHPYTSLMSASSSRWILSSVIVIFCCRSMSMRLRNMLSGSIICFHCLCHCLGKGLVVEIVHLIEPSCSQEYVPV